MCVCYGIWLLQFYCMQRGDNMNDELEYCYLRLPCGVCRLTMTDCPKLNQLAYITTYTGTTPSCEANMYTERWQNEVTR